MTLQLKCDRCGMVGTPDEVPMRQDYDSDLCGVCYRAEKIEDLKREIAEKKEWLESTVLKELRELEKELAELERS